MVVSQNKLPATPKNRSVNARYTPKEKFKAYEKLEFEANMTMLPNMIRIGAKTTSATLSIMGKLSPGIRS